MTSEITERELLVLVQASRRTLLSGKIAVVYQERPRMLDLDAIDVERTLPRVIFSKAG